MGAALESTTGGVIMARMFVVIFILASLVVGCVPVKKGSASILPSVAKEIRVDARQFGFTPTEIRVRAGERFRLLVSSADVEHRLVINGLAPERETVQGRLQTIEMTAWPPGTYTFDCAVACGTGHILMKGRLIIE